MKRMRSDRSIVSLERLLLMSASIEGTDAAEWLSGDGDDNSIFAAGGDDEIYAPIGNNTIDGGSGHDTLVIYEGRQADYSLEQVGNGEFLLEGPGLNGQNVANRLINVERISFTDGAVTLGEAAEPAPQTPVQSEPVETPLTPVDSNGAGQWISGTDGNDNINAGAGNDFIHAPIGSNSIDGGAGFDTLVIYEGNRSDFGVSAGSNGGFVVAGPGLNGLNQTNEIINVEAIQFNDQVLLLSTPSAAGNSTPSPEPEPQSQAEPPAPPPAEPVASPPAATTPDADFMSEVVRLTNEIRIQFGLSELQPQSELDAAAISHSESMAFGDYFSHVGQDGRQPWDRAEDAGYNYQTVGENIAAGQLTPEEVVQAWFDSPSHRDNILNPNFTEIGVGYVYLEDDFGSINYNHYWTQLLGTEF